MCTLSILIQRSARYPLVVAANRDESRLRPSRAPFVWPGPPAFVAGRDERAGGTWLGVNEHGVFVGLTNLWTGRPPDASRASRGEVVVRALRHASVEEVAAWMATQPPGATNPFLLVCASAHGDAFWTLTEDGLDIHALEPGIHSFGNVMPPQTATPKLAAMTRRFETAWREHRRDEVEEIVPVLEEALGTHTGDRSPQESICVHTGGEYGTVSSTVMLVSPSIGSSRLFHAPGPPCVTPFEDLSDRMIELGRRLRRRSR